MVRLYKERTGHRWFCPSHWPMDTACLARIQILVLSTGSQTNLHKFLCIASLGFGLVALPRRSLSNSTPRSRPAGWDCLLLKLYFFLTEGLFKHRLNLEKEDTTRSEAKRAHPCTKWPAVWQERFDSPKMALPSLECILEVTGATRGESPVK